jgi:hypothetical protein
MGEESLRLRSPHQAGLQFVEPSRLEALTHTPERLWSQPWGPYGRHSGCCGPEAHPEATYLR